VCSVSSAADPAEGNAVDVVLVGSEAQVRPMRAVTEEMLARLGVAATITFEAEVDPTNVINPRPGAEPRVARAWIDLSRQDRATLYLVDREWERVLIRHLPRTPGHDELAREAIGHILETAVDALLHGARIGIVREDAERELEGPPSSTPPAPPPSSATISVPSARSDSSRGFHVAGGAEYEGVLYANGGVVTHGPAGTLHVAAGSGTFQPALWFTLQYRLPLTVDAHPLGIRLDAGAARALAGFDAAISERVAIRFGVGAGVDVMHLTPRSEDGSGTSVAADQTFAVVVARSSVGVALSLSRHVAMVSVLSCDLDPSDTRYVSIVNGARFTALSPWTFRPALSLGVEVP
jgi:hypothetical protein